MSFDGAGGPRELACLLDVTDELVEAARLAGLRAVAAPHVAALGTRLTSAPGEVAGVVVDAVTCTMTVAMSSCKTLRRLDPPSTVPLVLIVDAGQLEELALRDELFDDFIVAPVGAIELATRLRHLLVARGAPPTGSVLEHDQLTVDLESYQAAIAGRALDLTYMEYELLRFFATNPGRVLSRETLLNRVWGYEYYGGARTVDVHVRRLRAKLGEEHAHLISTVRSVGYRFG